MNTIIIQGIIKDICFSHYIQDIEYYKANIVVKKEDNKEDIIPIKFKRFCNKHKEGDLVNLIGNIRTLSERDGNSHVARHVFTYFDLPEQENIKLVKVDGNICKKGELRKTKTGLDVLDFIIANNIENSGRLFNTYVPIVAWGKQAKQINKLNVGDYLNIEGHFSSRVYKKPNEDKTFDLKIAYEVNVDKILENNE